MSSKVSNKSSFNKSGKYKSEFYSSRVLFTFEACVGSTLYALTTGAFMAGFASLLGASDRYNGLIAVIPMIAGMAQIFAPLILERLTSRKPVIAAFIGVYKILIGSVVFIPLLVSDPSLRLALLFLFNVLAYTSANLVMPGFSSWLTGVVPENVRGKYFGIKDSYALAVNTTITLIMGFVLDSYKGPDAPYASYTGFAVVFSIALVLGVINIFLLVAPKEPKIEPSATKVKIRDCFTKPFSNKIYMKVVLLFILWNLGLNIGVPFLAVYQVKYLQLDYKYIMFLTLATNITMVIALRFWGKYADRFTWIHSTSLSIGVLALTQFIWGFTTKQTMFLLPIVFILGGVAWGGVNISIFNLPFMFAPKDNKTVYLGFNAAVGGLFGLVANLLAGQFVNTMEGKKIQLAFFSVSSIQIVLLASSLLLCLCSLFAATKLKKAYYNRKNC